MIDALRKRKEENWMTLPGAREAGLEALDAERYDEAGYTTDIDLSDTEELEVDPEEESESEPEDFDSAGDDDLSSEED
jgi:hypothetical protein